MTTDKQMKNKYLTAKQVLLSCQKHKYLLFRTADGILHGINAKIAQIQVKRNNYAPNIKTKYIGFIPCNFNKYISNKLPFYKSN